MSISNFTLQKNKDANRTTDKCCDFVLGEKANTAIRKEISFWVIHCSQSNNGYVLHPFGFFPCFSKKGEQIIKFITSQETDTPRVTDSGDFECRMESQPTTEISPSPMILHRNRRYTSCRAHVTHAAHTDLTIPTSLKNCPAPPLKIITVRLTWMTARPSPNPSTTSPKPEWKRNGTRNRGPSNPRSTDCSAPAPRRNSASNS